MESQKTVQNDDRAEQFIKLGNKLKSIREAQKLEIAEISQQTKIQKHYLAAIEEGNIDLLPKGPFARSFIKQYCEVLSAQDIWNSYDALTKVQIQTTPLPESMEEKAYSEAPKVFKSRSFLWIYVLIALSVGAAAWITWQYRGDLSNVAVNPVDGGTSSAPEGSGAAEPTPEPLPAVVTEQKASPASSDTVVPALAASGDTSVDLGWMDGKPLKPKTPVKAVVAVSADKISSDASVMPVQSVASGSIKVVPKGVIWIKASVKGKELFQGIIRPGEDKTFEVSQEAPLRIRYGNPGKSSVVWQGSEINPVSGGSKPVTKYYWYDGRVTDNQ